MQQGIQNRLDVLVQVTERHPMPWPFGAPRCLQMAIDGHAQSFRQSILRHPLREQVGLVIAVFNGPVRHGAQLGSRIRLRCQGDQGEALALRLRPREQLLQFHRRFKKANRLDHHQHVLPPSIITFAPVMYEDASDTKKMTAALYSSGCAILPNGISWLTRSTSSGGWPAKTPPGDSALTLTPCGAQYVAR